MVSKKPKIDQKIINEQLFLLNEKLHRQLGQQNAEMDALRQELSNRIDDISTLSVEESLLCQDAKLDKIQRLVQQLELKIETLDRDHANLTEQDTRNAEHIVLLENNLKEWVAKAVNDMSNADKQLIERVDRIANKLKTIEDSNNKNVSRFETHLASLQTDMDQLGDLIANMLTDTTENLYKRTKTAKETLQKTVAKLSPSKPQNKSTAMLFGKANFAKIANNNIANFKRPAMVACLAAALFLSASLIVPKFMAQTTIQSAQNTSKTEANQTQAQASLHIDMPPTEIAELAITPLPNDEGTTILANQAQQIIPVFDSSLPAQHIEEYLTGQIVSQNQEPIIFAVDKALANYIFDENLPDIIMQLQADALSGQPDAQHDLGMVYTIGTEDIEPDAGRAAFWFKQAALRKHPNAQYNLGVLYGQGLGLKQDDELAFFWYQQAARTGHPQAIYNVGVSYAEGVGTKQNLDKAHAHFIQAAQDDVPHASYYIALFYEDGIIGQAESRKDQAIYWYQQALAQGFPKAGEALARLDPTGQSLDQIMPAAGGNNR